MPADVAAPMLLRSDGELVRSLVDSLLDTGQISTQALERAKRVAEHEDRRLDIVLNRLGLLDDDALARSWSEITKLPLLDEKDMPASAILPDKLHGQFLKDAQVLPVRIDDGWLLVAVSDPLDRFSRRSISARIDMDVHIALAGPRTIARAIERLYETSGAVTAAPGHELRDRLPRDLDRLRDADSEAPAVRFVIAMIDRAAHLRATDIHLTLGMTGPRLRLRIDGMLLDQPPPSAEIFPSLISRLKVLAGLDISQRRLPQDGAFRYVLDGREMDVRVATMPHIHGEGVVLRLLDRAPLRVDIEDLGICNATAEHLRRAVSRTNGLILLCGPTGSGKTTTLYAALRSIQRTDRNIVTIEDPVEYALEGASQIEVSSKVGLTFEIALRSLLRQDPNVILIGEIRNDETAAIAARAAMTGNLVLGSVHTGSAVETIQRLTDLGVARYVVASTIRLVIAQRLVRKLCMKCRRPARSSDRDRGSRWSDKLAERALVFEPCGCADCRGTGFNGRTVISEALSMTTELASMISRGAPQAELSMHARQAGEVTLQSDACEKVILGITSACEIDRVLGFEHDADM